MRWGMWMSSSRIWRHELVVPRPRTTHAYKCDIISATAEPGILVCWRCHTNIRQRWGHPEDLCGRILHCNQQMLGLYEAMTTGSSVCMCMGPTREPVRRLKRTPRKGKAWQQQSWFCLIWLHLRFSTHVIKLSAHTESESAMGTRTSTDWTVYLSTSCLQMLTLEPSNCMRKYLW